MKVRDIILSAGFASLAMLIPACGGGVDDGSGNPDPDPDPGQPAEPGTPPQPPVVQPPVPDIPAEYRRMSLAPLFQLTPQNEQDRFEIFDFELDDQDFVSNAVTTSIEAKLLRISKVIGEERGTGDLDLFIGNDENRAADMPFRGNPTDVKFAVVEGTRKAVVPLGGGVSDPGNEIAIVDLDNNNVQRVEVGIHPQRVALPPQNGNDQDDDVAFVCNQYSNYISVVDIDEEELLVKGGEPVEIKTEFYCTDLLLVERTPGIGGEVDELFLYVANEFRGSVLKYSINIERDINDNVEDVIVNAPDGQDEHVPLAEIFGVGKNPYRLALNGAQSQIFVANNRGGELGLFQIGNNQVVERRALLAPTLDVVEIANHAFVGTTTPFRGLLNQSANARPSEVEGDPIVVTGADGRDAELHPGAMFDQTDSYNFEDVRDGIFQINNNLSGQPDYVTNIQEADDFFADDQKVMVGSIPWDLERNAAGNRLYAAMFGSDIVQEFVVVGGNDIRLQQGDITFNTAELPTAVALDEDGNRLLAVTMGGDFLEVFDLAAGGDPIDQIDLGFANPRYPATVVEAGEYFYSTAKWANDTTKACSTCHVDRLLTDGVGYSNGVTAPTQFHQVKPNYNLMETDNYFWNGAFTNNSYASLAYAAQSRTNCELILFALIEGPDSDPAQRVGDEGNFTSAATDVICRPNIDLIDAANGLPTSLEGDANGDGNVDFTDIAEIIAEQKQVAFTNIGIALQEQIERVNGVFDANDGQFNRDFTSSAMDFYGAAELRLPPNPVAQMAQLNMLSSKDAEKLALGEEIFRDVANCDSCHDPNDSEMPFADGREHGSGGEYVDLFIREFGDDDVVLDLLANIGLNDLPEEFIASGGSDFTLQEINYHADRLDFFVPFCFTADENGCLSFDDPFGAGGNNDEEEQRLARITLINLADPDRGHIPGQPNGQVKVNTPSLRGVWLQHNLLRHGLAFSFREAILPPGHEALREGEKGWAMDRRGDDDVHGETSQLSEAEVEALELYLQSIE